MENYIIVDDIPDFKPVGRKRKYHDDRAASGKERQAKINAKKKQSKIEHIAVFDCETDPFDKLNPDHKIMPFCGCLYWRDKDGPQQVVIWEENPELFVDQVIEAILALPDEYTIYAHNGGKFDWMFFIHKLRGEVSFKGRGLMSAKIGPHEIRDSYHIIPEKLAAYRKEEFDYQLMRKGKRRRHKQKIINYLISDCVYSYEIIKGFLDRFGFKISIGQAAMTELKQLYKVKQIANVVDLNLRPYFFGGRVECLQGKGHFVGHYKLYDVNSMYPDAMAHYQHPVSNNYTKRTKGGINENTVFLELSCDNYGALVMRDEENKTSANVRYGRFFTTIHEYNAAMELGLIDRIKFHSFIDNDDLNDFKNFVYPLYEKRLETKALLKTLQEGQEGYAETKRKDIFVKLLLNNGYGKFAQNPRRFKDHYLTEPGEPAPEGWPEIPEVETPYYWIYSRPAEQKRMRFNNVGTAASITGAARATLMRAIAQATDPIYCDTDSLICRDLRGVEIDKTKLGAWDIEAEFSEVIICGKKQYACKIFGTDDKYKIRSKGVSGLEWNDFIKMLNGDAIAVLNNAPTLTKNGDQFYMERNVRATAPLILPHKVSRIVKRNAG